MKNQTIKRLLIEGTKIAVSTLNDTICDFKYGETISDTLVEDNKDKQMFFLAGVKIDEPLPKSNRYKAKDIYKRNYLVIDCDDLKFSDYDKLKESLDNSSYFNDYSMINFTGGGFHIYFIGDEIDLKENEWLYAEEQIHKLFEKQICFPPDYKAKGIYRIIRYPGSFNHKKNRDGSYKYGKIVEGKVLSEIDRESGILSAMEFYAGSTPTETEAKEINSKELRDIFENGAREGTRNDSLAKVIGVFLKAEREPGNHLSWSVLQLWNKYECNPPMPNDELKRIFESISKRDAKQVIEQEVDFVDTPASELRREEQIPNPFIVSRMIPENALTELYGRTGCGKSLVALHIADRVSKGEPVFNKLETKKTPTLYIDLEMSRDDLITRVNSIAEKSSDELYISVQQSWKFDNPKAIEYIEKAVEERNVGFVILDTYSKIHSQASEDSAMEMTPVMDALNKMAQRLKISIMFLHHMNKNSEAKGYSQSRGSTTIPDNSACCIGVDSKEHVDGDKKFNVLTLTQHKKRREEAFDVMSLKVVKYDGITSFEETDHTDTLDAQGRAISFIKRLLTEKYDTPLCRAEIKEAIKESGDGGANSVDSATTQLVFDKIVVAKDKEYMNDKKLLTEEEYKRGSTQKRWYILAEPPEKKYSVEDAIAKLI